MRRPAWFTKASLVIAGTAQDPVRFVAKLRSDDPVFWIPHYDAWLVTRHEDVRALFADSRLTTDPRAYERHIPSDIPGAARWLSAQPFRSLQSDPQSVPRRLAMGVLTPRAVERTERRVFDVVEQCAAPLRGRSDVVDLMKEFTNPVARIAIGRILGVPPKGSDEARFRVLARNSTRGIRPFLSEEKRHNTESATVEVCEYVLQLVEEHRREPADDMISDLLRASRASTSEEIDDIVRIVAALVAAGTGTVGMSCARALHTLLLHPEELSLLRGERSLIPNAVDELLRYDSGLPVVPRYALEDFEFRGRSIKKGQLVLPCILSANRDPAVFTDPDRVDLRRDCKQALSFGYGAHFCTGTAIARIQLRLMLDAALDLLPVSARLLPDQIRWTKRGMMGQMKTLPVDFAE